MTDKQPYTPLPTTQAPTLDQLSRSHAGRLRHRTVVFIAVAVLLLVCFQWHKQSREFVPGVWEDEKGDGVMRGKKVGVELFVMSKCPDAVKCEEVFGNVLAKVSSITNITTTYIGQENEDAEYGATCKHGDGECLGAIHQLCIRDTYPDPYNWYNYILCVNQQNRLIPDWGQAERCAEVVGLLKSGKKWEKVQECVDGKRGRELLGRSVGRVAEMGVR
ncbi:hypothetical protein HK097_005519 [Rhizophlyctis rosea]|uniref:Uncharacterized protein n=1 Tax=Rhizophlyctis rosea TaxID=64517 RepID=A0AAD5SEZ5_9FUNG|nr:hypothetical protein HK097_005519 [Rhizophlyctis rosea]